MLFKGKKTQLKKGDIISFDKRDGTILIAGEEGCPYHFETFSGHDDKFLFPPLRQMEEMNLCLLALLIVNVEGKKGQRVRKCETCGSQAAPNLFFSYKVV